MAAAVDEVLRDIQGLTSEDQRRVRDALDDLLGDAHVPTSLQRRMIEAGLIAECADPRKRAEHIRSFEPVKLEGELVSEQIIRERR